jgi:YHS domain-containing protein
MNNKTQQFEMFFLVVGLLIVGLIAINGCKKSEPAPPAEPEGRVAAKIEQTTCPVMAGPVNKALFTEYKGKKVYFCCPGCKEKFDAEPEKYIAKLPQFSK